MKKLLYSVAILGVLSLSSCGADQATVDKLTEEMCTALDGVTMDDPVGLLNAATAMSEIATKDEYSSVTEAQLKDGMKEKCPEAYKTLEELVEAGQE